MGRSPRKVYRCLESTYMIHTPTMGGHEIRCFSRSRPRSKFRRTERSRCVSCPSRAHAHLRRAARMACSKMDKTLCKAVSCKSKELSRRSQQKPRGPPFSGSFRWGKHFRVFWESAVDGPMAVNRFLAVRQRFNLEGLSQMSSNKCIANY